MQQQYHAVHFPPAPQQHPNHSHFPHYHAPAAAEAYAQPQYSSPSYQAMQHYSAPLPQPVQGYMEPHIAQQSPNLEQTSCDAAVAKLHFETKFKCKSCGLRYKEKQQLIDHLEAVHYVEHVRRCKHRQSGSERGWYSATALQC
jgi:predicted RNA-binding Zn-ribbon protein involved in translation (DUF1610 family)